MTLSPTINETLKWLSSLPILTQESFWWCCDTYIIPPSTPTPPLGTPFPPFSPSLKSLMVSVDVKHHVYLLLKAPYKTINNTITGTPPKLQYGNVFYFSFFLINSVGFNFLCTICLYKMEHKANFKVHSRSTPKHVSVVQLQHKTPNPNFKPQPNAEPEP